MNALFKQTANIYENNKEFQSGLVVAVLKAAVAKEISWSNAKTDVRVEGRRKGPILVLRTPPEATLTPY